MIALAAFALGACLAIEGAHDHIRAADLARADALWEAVAPDTRIALAPLPGVQRVMRIAELRALAARWNVRTDPSRDVCFTRPVALLAPERIVAAMRKELPEAHIDLVEFSRAPAPDGEIEFPRSGLRAGYWYGYISYGAGRRFIVWARVNVTATLQRIVASTDISPGEPIDPAQLRVDTLEARADLPGVPSVESPDDIAAWIPRRRIPAGSPIDKRWLDPPKLVRRGDAVKVEVTAGAAVLRLDAIAEGAGGLGDWIPIQNPDSKRRFRARVEAKGKVSVKDTQ